MQWNQKVGIAALTLGGLLAAAWLLLPGGSSGPEPLSLEDPRAEDGVLAAPREPTDAALHTPALATQQSDFGRTVVNQQEEVEAEPEQEDLASVEPRDASEGDIRFCAVDAEGEPLSTGITVRLHVSETGAKYPTELGVLQPDVMGCAALPSNSHDGYGVLTFQAELPEGTAWAQSDPLLLVAGGSLDLGRVVLMTPRQRYPVPLLSGSLLDDRGQPVKNAKGTFGVELSQQSGETLTAQLPGQVEVDGAGRFMAYGPDSAGIGSLKWTADGYQFLVLEGIELPSLDLDLIMARHLRTEGRIVVPEGWPPLEEYGVWGRSEAGASGIRVQEDGSFSAPMSVQSLIFEVTYPVVGFKIHSSPQAEPAGDVLLIGDVDLGQFATLHSFVVLGPDGEPLVNALLKAATEADAPPFNTLKTDADGRYSVILPRTTKRLNLARHGQSGLDIDLARVGESVRLP